MARKLTRIAKSWLTSTLPFTGCQGDMTLGLTTFSKMTLGLKGLFATFNINDTLYNIRYSECFNAEVSNFIDRYTECLS